MTRFIGVGVGLSSAVSDDINSITMELGKRAKTIMMRNKGLMRDANSAIQHFNPVCRLSRKFPQLTICRLLMSLNDHDIPPKPQKEKPTAL
jgi:hypothetical protein